MNRDEFAFFNEQLAAMLRSGVPLEGALKQLCLGMRKGALRDELQLLESDLARGRPLREAVSERNLPELYRRLLVTGVEGGDLPGLLTLAADHYHQAANLRTRLSGLMVYPFLALLTSLAVSLLLARVLGTAAQSFPGPDDILPGPGDNGIGSRAWTVGLWLTPLFFAFLTLLALAVVGVPRLRHALRWRLPGFRDASLSQLAGSLALLLRGGSRLPDAVRLCADLETGREAARELRGWDEQLARGDRRFGHDPGRRGIFPPLFLWLITSDPEDWPSGFARAAEIYGRRAQARVETLLYAALPVAVLLLGGLVLGQAAFAVRVIYATLVVQLEAFGG